MGAAVAVGDGEGVGASGVWGTAVVIAGTGGDVVAASVVGVGVAAAATVAGVGAAPPLSIGGGLPLGPPVKTPLKTSVNAAASPMAKTENSPAAQSGGDHERRFDGMARCPVRAGGVRPAARSGASDSRGPACDGARGAPMPSVAPQLAQIRWPASCG